MNDEQAEWGVWCDDDADMPVVCVAHGGFIPCRKSGEHQYTSSPDLVESVRRYHASPIEGLTWANWIEACKAYRLGDTPQEGRA